MAELDLDQIQGAVLRGYRLPVAGYLFLRVDDAARARRWLAAVSSEIITSAPWDEKPASAVNLCVSFTGLRALGLPQESLDTFPEEFRRGMAARADLLGDRGESAPENWEGGLGTPDIHLMIMVSTRDHEVLDDRRRSLVEGIEREGGLSIVSEQRGASLPENREHFGFRDGFSQPAVEGSGIRALPGQGAPEGPGHWRPIKAGEFILGYPDEEGILPEAPSPDVLTRNGTFVVYRKLRQDVARFRAIVSEAARHYPGGEELLAAKIMGRWRDGTPLALSPDRPDPVVVADPNRNNAFGYGDDVDGMRCPVGAHIRRANPRDGVFFPKLVNRHRIIRRGILYGDPLPPGAPDDGADRGVIFMCLQASIARQFEFIQSQWMEDGNAFRLGDDKDVILGDNDGKGKMTVQGRPPYFVGPLSRVVTVRGGEYFFAPGMNGLRYLSALEGSPA